jgi:DNA-binding CsgD family transcriptional regulator
VIFAHRLDKIDHVVWRGAAGMDGAEQNWSFAVRTYRASVTVYSQVMSLRERRRGLKAVAPPAVPGPQVPAPPPVSGLTTRESEIAQLVALGYSNPEIADKLIITRGTVANHVAHILDRLGVANRAQVAAWAARHGLLDELGMLERVYVA